jgi:RNA polymerase sigma factor (sigma-70 family)
VLIARTPEGAAAPPANDAVTLLYGTHYRTLVRLAALLTGSTAAAERVAQDSFVALYGAWPRLGGHDAAVSYLRWSVVRGSRLTRRLPSGQPQAPGSPGDPAQPSMPGEPGQAELMATLRALPARQREAVVLRYYLDLTDNQAAAAMGISPPALRTHAARAAAALQRAC